MKNFVFAVMIAVGLSSFAGADETRNQDVQTLGVYDSQSLAIRGGSSTSAGSTKVPIDSCQVQGMSWEQVRGSEPGTRVDLDCTASASRLVGLPTMRAILTSGSRTRPGNEDYYGI